MAVEQICSWVLSLAVCAMAGAAVLALSPNGSLEKAVKTTVSVFLICSTALPLFSLKSDIDIEIPEFQFSSENNNSIAEEISSQTAAGIKKNIEDILSQNGISQTDADIKMKVSGDEISVESVTVKINQKYFSRVEEIKKLIKDKLGIIADVKVEK